MSRSGIFVVGITALNFGVGCGLIAGVEWDRVKIVDSDGGTSGVLPDGAPGGGDGSIPTGGCGGSQVECVAAGGLGCCPRSDDVGAPASIAAGGSNTCATTTTGQIPCWGPNALGQLGRGTDAALQTSNK